MLEFVFECLPKFCTDDINLSKSKAVVGFLHRLIAFWNFQKKVLGGVMGQELLYKCVQSIESICSSNNQDSKTLEFADLGSSDVKKDEDLVCQCVEILGIITRILAPSTPITLIQSIQKISDNRKSPEIKLLSLSSILTSSPKSSLLTSLQSVLKVCCNPSMMGDIFFRQKVLSVINQLSILVLSKDSGNQDEKDTATKLEIFKSCNIILKQIFAKFWSQSKMNWETRFCFADTVKIFLHNDLFDENDQNFFTNLFIFMLKDNDYRVRLYMSKAITIFFEIYSVQEEIFNQIYKDAISPVFGSFFHF